MNVLSNPVVGRVIGLLSSKILTAVISFTIFFLIVSYFDKEQVGVYVFLLGVVTILSMISNFGTNEYILRLGATDTKNISEVLRVARNIKLVLSTALGILVGVIIFNFTEFHHDILIYILLLFNAIIDLQSLSYIMMFRVNNRTRVEVLFFTLRAGLKLLLVIIILSFSSSFTATILALLVSNILGLIFIFNKYNKDLAITSMFANKIKFSSVLNSAKPFAYMSITIAIFSQAPVVIAGNILSKSTLADLGLVLQVYTVAIFFPVSINIAVQPNLSRVYEANQVAWKTKLIKLTFFVLPLSLIAAVLMFHLIPLVVDFIFGEKYKSSTELIQLLSFALFFRFANSSIIATSYISAKWMKYYNRIYSIATLTIIIFSLIFINVIGVKGAVLAIVVSEGLLFSLAMYYLIRKIRTI